MAKKFAWFGILRNTNDLQQGTILRGFPFIDFSLLSYNKLMSDSDESNPLKVEPVDVIVLTQSCDLTSDKVDSIVVCAIYTLGDYIKHAGLTRKKANDLIGNLNSRRVTNMFLLNKCNIKKFGKKYDDYMLVKFDEAIILPKTFINDAFKSSSEHIVLNPPYRESLAQAFGLFFMRVGNPQDVEKPDINYYIPIAT